MTEDYEIMRVIVKVLEGLISQGDRIIKGGQNLSDVKIEIGVSGGAYADFCKWVDRVKQINKEHNYGYDPELESLGNFKVGNWSELVAKCSMLLPIAEQFRNKLPAPSRALVGRRRAQFR